MARYRHKKSILPPFPTSSSSSTLSRVITQKELCRAGGHDSCRDGHDERCCRRAALPIVTSVGLPDPLRNFPGGI